MPLYEYEHCGESCPKGKIFEIMQSSHDEVLSECPVCGGMVRRVISRVSISCPKTDSDLKGMGFTKLVRKDKGVYENVTALDGESRIWESDKPSTMPDLKRRIQD